MSTAAAGGPHRVVLAPSGAVDDTEGVSRYTSRMNRGVAQLALFSLSCLFGCKKPCGNYAEHLAGFAAPGRQATVREAALQACENGKVTTEEIDCVLKTTNERDAYRCHRAAGAASTPPPAPRVAPPAASQSNLRRVTFFGFSRNGSRPKEDIRRVLYATWLPRWRACLSRGRGPDDRQLLTPMPQGLLDFAVKLNIAGDGRMRVIQWSTGDESSRMVDGKEPGAAEKACFEQSITSGRWEGQATGDTQVKVIFRMQRER